jgi:hypothetical protein
MQSGEATASAVEEASKAPLPTEETKTEQLETVTFTNEELKDDFICHQTEEKNNALFSALQTGFQSLQEARDTNKTPLLIPSKTDASETNGTSSVSHKTVSMRVVVNVIDPTTKPQSATAPKADNLLARSRLTAPSPYIQLVENVYEKLSAIFESDYGNTLRAVQYKNVRSGASDVISTIPVQMVLTRTGTASGTGEANVAWGGLAGSAATASMDPAEWHSAPFCHVYVAACENVDHYRTKVRPSIQAFVSQLEASLGPPSIKTSSVIGSSMGSSSTPTSNAHYLIIYVPLGGEGPEKSASPRGASEDGIAANSGPMRRVLASQFAKARERIANYQQDLDNSTHSADSLASMDKTLMDDDADTPSIALQMLTMNDKIIFKKMMKDFPSGKICVISKSSLDKPPGADAKAGMTPDVEKGTVIRHQEWNAFNRMLGSVIVNGFVDRCRRYNDELRRLDSQRAMAAQAMKSQTVKAISSGGVFGGNTKDAKGSTPMAEFNLGYFFLVKESLAFTYEQMQLPTEALLQYDEFRAFLPDLTDNEYKKAIKLRRKSKALRDDAGPPLMELADAADVVGFRKRLRTEFDLTPILEIIRRYLFAREIRLLFKMEQPVEVIARCEVFCKYMYSVMMRGITTCSAEERKRREIDAAKWVVQFAWDVKTACETYLSSVGGAEGLTSITSFDIISPETSGTDLSSDSGHSTQSGHYVASRLGEFLEMARLLYKQLGDVELPGENPLRKYEHNFPVDMLKKWESWVCPDLQQGDAQPNFHHILKASQGEGRQFILENAFISCEGYEDTYLKIIAAIVSLGRYGHRRRLALRLQAELAENLIRRGELRIAASILKSAVKLYRADQWDRCHFWRLFRLSYCQRSTANPTEYLKTLAACFSPRTSAVAPKKALEALQDDLEGVMHHQSIGESKYGTIAFLETSIEVMETASDTSRMGSGVDSKELIKRYCSVGEKVYINMTLSSSLPRDIIVDSLKLLIVDFATFSSVVENRESVEEQDAFKTLTLDGGIKVKPGPNVFQFEWIPTTSGQFILSTIEIVWKEGYFYYDSMELLAPLLGVDVLPSEPTHALSIEPAYLVPGHDQEIRITFDAGSDLVTASILQLTCSQGLLMIGPGEDPADGQWKKECEIKLGSFKPGDKTTLTAHIRCALIETFSHDSISQAQSFDTAHGLNARAFTKYLHAVAETSDFSSTPEMKNVSEAFAPILEKTALSAESVDIVWLTTGESVLISIDLMSNTPDRFSIMEWSLLVPTSLKLAEDVDHNDYLRNCSVSDRDRLALIFECTVAKDAESADRDDAILRAKLCDDNGKMFTLDLPLDMSKFYLNLLGSSSTKKNASARATLQLAVDEGPVGEPIMLSFTVETEADGNIVYSIDSAGSEWLLSGKVSGSMQRSGFMSLGFMGTCDIIGIPTVPGVLTSFPKIQLGTVSLQGGYSPLTMHLTSPGRFRSLAKTSAIAVAFPTNKIAV